MTLSQFIIPVVTWDGHIYYPIVGTVYNDRRFIWMHSKKCPHAKLVNFKAHEIKCDILYI